TAASPLVSSGGSTPEISMPAASGSQDGYLAQADYTRFDSKLTSDLQEGQVFVGNASDKAAAVVISGDATLAADGTLTLKNTGTVGTYTKVTTDAQGRVTSGSTTIGSADISDLEWSKVTS